MKITKWKVILKMINDLNRLKGITDNQKLALLKMIVDEATK